MFIIIYAKNMSFAHGDLRLQSSDNNKELIYFSV